MTTGYAEFVNGGRKLEPTLIDRVQDRHGKTVYRFDMRNCPDCNQADWHGQEEPLLEENQAQVLDPRARRYQIVSILQGVVQRGTGTVVNTVGKPLAGKTGTSSDFKDAWFVGFTPDLVAGVYIGKDDFTTRWARASRARWPPRRSSATSMKEALADKPAFRSACRKALCWCPVNAANRRDTVPAGTRGPPSWRPFKPGAPNPACRRATAWTTKARTRRQPRAEAQPPHADTVNVQIGTGTGGLYLTFGRRCQPASTSASLSRMSRSSLWLWLSRRSLAAKFSWRSVISGLAVNVAEGERDQRFTFEGSPIALPGSHAQVKVTRRSGPHDLA